MIDSNIYILHNYQKLHLYSSGTIVRRTFVSISVSSPPTFSMTKRRLFLLFYQQFFRRTVTLEIDILRKIFKFVFIIATELKLPSI